MFNPHPRRTKRKKAVKKSKDSKYPTWTSIKGRTFTLRHSKDTLIGKKYFEYEAQFIYKSNDYVDSIVIDRLKRLNDSRYSTIFLPRDRFRKSVFMTYDRNRILVSLTNTEITKVDGVPIRKMFGLCIKDWPLWALKAAYLHRISKKFGKAFSLSGADFVDLTGRLDKQFLLQLINKCNKAPLALANKKTKELEEDGYYENKIGSRTSKTPNIKDRELGSLLQEVFTL